MRAFPLGSSTFAARPRRSTWTATLCTASAHHTRRKQRRHYEVFLAANRFRKHAHTAWNHVEISRYKLQKLHTRPQDLTSREFFLYQKCVWPRHSGVRFKSEVEFTYVLSRSRFHVFLFLVENFLFCEKMNGVFVTYKKICKFDFGICLRPGTR